MALVLPLVATAPEFASIALVAGLLGGVFPDLDLYAGHRKTLHFPVFYSAVATVAVVVAALIPTTRPSASPSSCSALPSTA